MYALEDKADLLFFSHVGVAPFAEGQHILDVRHIGLFRLLYPRRKLLFGIKLPESGPAKQVAESVFELVPVAEFRFMIQKPRLRNAGEVECDVGKLASVVPPVVTADARELIQPVVDVMAVNSTKRGRVPLPYCRRRNRRSS